MKMARPALILLAAVLFMGLPAGNEKIYGDVTRSSLEIKLRFMAGFRYKEQANVITSYYLQPFFSGSITTDFSAEKEIEELKSVFHLNEVHLLNEADLSWESAMGKSIYCQVQFKSNEYLIALTPKPRSDDAQFEVEISEKKNEGSRNLLSTQLILPYAQVAVLGFQDSEKKPYFISFHVQEGVTGGIAAGGELGAGYGSTGIENLVVPGVKAMISRPDHALVAVARFIAPDKAPSLLKKVEPDYPSIARQARIQGTVVLEVVVDSRGKVAATRIIHGHPLLNESARHAIERWVFKPYIENGQAVPVRFEVYQSFILKEVEPSLMSTARFLTPESVPHITRQIDPVYPRLALSARIQGMVVLEVMIDSAGKVIDSRLLSGHPLLNAAAIDAIKQWVFTPYKENGKPIPVRFRVTVNFDLGSMEPLFEPKPEAAMAKKLTGHAAKLIKRVEPIYPPSALAKRIQGVVVLEAQTDAEGNVASIKVQQGHPELVIAALKAVKQWKYKPVQDGERKVPIAFSVTVSFILNDSCP